MGRNSIFFLFLSLFLSLPDQLFAQTTSNYFVFFKSKYPTSYTIHRPDEFLSCEAIERRERHGIEVLENDLPVSNVYLDSLKGTSVNLLFTSKWLNGVMISATVNQLMQLSKFSFVKKIIYKDQWTTPTKHLSSLQSLSGQSANTTNIDFAAYGQSYAQNHMPGTDLMHNDGFAGSGVVIAVIDDGFNNANLLPVFDSLYYYNRVKATYDFLHNETNVYNDGTGHGTQVLSILAGYSDSNLIGAAWKATYLLLRSEYDSSETITEEYNWVRAAEFADSAGADIISSSLGYNQFDNPAYNHVYSDLNGHTTVITIGAETAASKGILVVNAAGNEGADSWQYILAPADGDSVLTVGGVDNNGNHVAYSSVGPTYDGRIKPDVVTLSNYVRYAVHTGGYASGDGTSYATPVISGLAAGLWQKFPQLTNMELMDYIKVSSSQYYSPDNLKGYGIPNYTRASQLIEQSNSISLYPNPTNGGQLYLHWATYQKNQDAELFFYSITGQLMATEKLIINNPIIPLVTEIQNWKTGIYLVKLVTTSGLFTTRLVRF